MAEGCKLASTFAWGQIPLPERANNFEDLAFLFWCTSLNRGLLRQDFDEAAALFRTIRSLDRPRGVEIGRFYGASTLLLAVAAGPQGRVISIDIAPKDDTALASALTKLGLLDRVELVVRDANEVQIEGSLDFVFIDGDHCFEAAKKDHNKWGALVRAGGYIIHHDMGNQRAFATQWSDLSKLRSEILTRQAGLVELVVERGSMAVFRRVSASWKAV